MDTPVIGPAPAPAHEVLVCVWFKLAPGHRDAVSGALRDIQRGLVADWPGLAAGLHLRSPLPGQAPDPAAPATLMETYRLDAGRAADLPALLADLDARWAAAPAAPLALLASPRHVELFLPCASPP